MKSKRVTGLVSAGGVGQSFVARLPRLLAAVGPVKATSFRVARRIVNILRSGHAVKDYAALEKCDVIWIAVPETTLERVIRDLAASARVHGTMIVLCGSVRDSYWPGVLRSGGARVASLNAIERDPRTLVAEGHADVLRELRCLAAAEKSKLIEIRPASKPLFLAGVHLSTDLVLPWIAAAVDSLRMAGFSRSEATGVVEALGARVLRAYGKAGHKAWRRTAVHRLHHAVDSDLETIRSADPHLAALYQAGIEQALGYFKNP
jgi:hypothetical protein